MNAPEKLLADSKAVVSMAAKMQEVGLRKTKRESYPPVLRQNVLTEISKGVSAKVAARRFNVRLPTVYAWVSKQKKKETGASPRKAIQPPAVDMAAKGHQDSTVTLSPQELKMLITVMRDAMTRVKSLDIKGQMAVLAFRLMDLLEIKR